MLQTLVQPRPALEACTAEHELPATLNTHQWGLIKNVLSLLATFEKLTKLISSSTATAADVIQAITALKQLLDRKADMGCRVSIAKTSLLEVV